jgi:hypothetical protein
MVLDCFQKDQNKVAYDEGKLLELWMWRYGNAFAFTYYGSMDLSISERKKTFRGGAYRHSVSPWDDGVSLSPLLEALDL